METLAHRLKDAMAKAGLTQSELARRIDISQQAIQRIVAGNSQRSKYLPEIAEVLGVDLKWLVNGQGAGATTNPAAPNMHRIDPPLLSNDLPILGKPTGRSDAINLDGRPIAGYTLRPPFLLGNDSSFAVYAPGSAMSPRYDHGELLWIDPMRPAKSGDYVIIQEADGTAYPRQLIDFKAESITVATLNPDQETVMQKDQVRHIYRIVGSWDL